MKDPAHPAHHMIQYMTMEEPVATLRRRELQGIGLHRHDIFYLFQWRIITLPVQHPKEMPVQMHRMPHHRPVIQDDPYILTPPDQYPVRLGDGLVIDRPDITVHIAGKIEMQDLRW